MKSFKWSLIVSVIAQLISWLLMFIVNDFINIGFNFSLIVGLLYGIILIVIYFICMKKIIAKYELKEILFKVFMFIICGLLTIGLTSLAFVLIEKSILHPCDGTSWDCLVDSLIYLVYGTELLAIETIITFIELIINGVKLIKSKMKAKN